MSILVAALVTLTVGVIFASIFEWILHKYVMHRPLGKFDYPYRAHDRTHHRVFEADHTYHLGNRADKAHLIRMAWWNCFILVPLATVPFLLVAYLLLWAPVEVVWTIAATGFVISAGYYAVYEGIHWCMHNPKGRWIERTALFYFIDRHHRLHHHNDATNLNVVFPFADLLLGTLVL